MKRSCEVSITLPGLHPAWHPSASGLRCERASRVRQFIRSYISHIIQAYISCSGPLYLTTPRLRLLVPHGSRCCQCGTIDAESQGALRDGRRGRGVAGTRGCTGGHPCSRGGGYGIPKPIPYKTLIELTCRAASVLPTCQRSLSCQAGCLARQGPSVFTGHGLPGSSTH